MILFSDLHLRPESAEVTFKQILPQIEDAALQDDQRIGFLGDWYHLRYQVGVELQNAVHEVFVHWAELGLQVDLLPGNHDQVDVHGRHALEVFGEHANVTVWTHPGWNNWGFWLPYRKNVEELRKALRLAVGANKEALEAVLKRDVPWTLFYHGAIVGAQMNDHCKATEGLSVEELKPWKRVLCGHYHRRQKLARGKIHFIGAPRQTRADEWGNDTGYAILSKDGKVKLETTWWGPRYHSVVIEPGGERPEFTEVRKGDHLHIVTQPGVDHDVLSVRLEELGLTNVVVEPAEVEASAQRMELQAGASFEEYVSQYVEMHAGELDQGRLMELFASLGEA